MEKKATKGSIMGAICHMFYQMIRGNIYSMPVYIFCNCIQMLQLIYAFLRPLQIDTNFSIAMDYFGYVMVNM